MGCSWDGTGKGEVSSLPRLGLGWGNLMQTSVTGRATPDLSSASGTGLDSCDWYILSLLTFSPGQFPWRWTLGSTEILGSSFTLWRCAVSSSSLPTFRAHAYLFHSAVQQASRDGFSYFSLNVLVPAPLMFSSTLLLLSILVISMSNC